MTRFGRSPTAAEISEALALDVDQVVEAMALEDTCHPRSLDGILESVERERSPAMEECLGEEDPELARVEDRIALSQALEELDPQLRRILRLRYNGNLTQQEAAQQLGISQMQVSRLERRALAQMRTQMAAA
jgi:RNA polymerase sigma-B factor